MSADTVIAVVGIAGLASWLAVDVARFVRRGWVDGTDPIIKSEGTAP